MISELRQLEETVFRLRRLHGVLDAALLLASEALYESVGGGLLVGEWHDTLIQRAVKELNDEGVFEGRWLLFTDEELAMFAAMLRSERNDEPGWHAMIGEIEDEIVRRGRATPEVS